MRKALITAFVCLLFGTFALAQDAPKVEIFGGYSNVSQNIGANPIPVLCIFPNCNAFQLRSFNSNGWNTAITGNFTKHFGVTADFGGAYGSSLATRNHLHTFLFGPSASWRGDKATVFTHALFGAGHLGQSADGIPTPGSTATQTHNAFATALGGGLDLNVGSKGWAIRLFQADYLLTRFNSANQNDFRVSTGLVYRWGRK